MDRSVSAYVRMLVADRPIYVQRRPPTTTATSLLPGLGARSCRSALRRRRNHVGERPHPRWIRVSDETRLQESPEKGFGNLAVDDTSTLVYLVPTRVSLARIIERWPEVHFMDTGEHHAGEGQ
jgi:hypothetical protein